VNETSTVSELTFGRYFNLKASLTVASFATAVLPSEFEGQGYHDFRQPQL
jgi:hypothetical protein